MNYYVDGGATGVNNEDDLEAWADRLKALRDFVDAEEKRWIHACIKSIEEGKTQTYPIAQLWTELQMEEIR